MNRLLLTSIGFAVLQAAAPRAAIPTDIRPGGESTRLAPRLEVPWASMLDRIGPRSEDARLRNAMPAVPAAPAGLDTNPASGAPQSTDPVRFAPVLLPSLLPDARAPPIQS